MWKGRFMPSVLELLQARYTRLSTELTAMDTSSTSRDGVVEFSVGDKRVRFDNMKAFDGRRDKLNHELESLTLKIQGLGGTIPS